MSMQHLDFLRDKLTNKGWDISNSYSTDLYYVANDCTVYWEISRGYGEPIILYFVIWGDLGNDSFNLNDIVYCRENQTGSSLYFYKINSKEWIENSKKWINNLKIAQE